MLSQIFGHEFHELELFDETTSTLFQAVERASELSGEIVLELDL